MGVLAEGPVSSISTDSRFGTLVGTTEVSDGEICQGDMGPEGFRSHVRSHVAMRYNLNSGAIQHWRPLTGNCGVVALGPRERVK